MLSRTVMAGNLWPPFILMGKKTLGYITEEEKGLQSPIESNFVLAQQRSVFVLSLTFSLSHSLAAKFFVPLLHLEMKKGRFHSNFDVGLSKLFLLSLLPSCGKIK